MHESSDDKQISKKQRRMERLAKRKAKFTNEPKRNISLIGKTENQKKFIYSLTHNDLIIAKGIAGTGKSYVATAFACKCMVDGRFDTIVLTRANIPTGRSIGFFPGTVEDKLRPWLAQNLAYISEFVGTPVMDIWIKNNQIQMVPIETMRGRSFSNACVICDESQNLTLEEIKCITTRIGDNSKLIMCGDGSQSDLKESAFERFAELLTEYKLNRTSIITFTIEDCLRSGLCSDLLFMFNKEKI
jgi:phosphate starvation-inducible PhoH-like protein